MQLACAPLALLCRGGRAAHRVGEHGDGLQGVAGAAKLHNAAALGGAVLILQQHSTTIVKAPLLTSRERDWDGQGTLRCQRCTQ